jgi:hypothetical protein
MVASQKKRKNFKRQSLMQDIKEYDNNLKLKSRKKSIHINLTYHMSY